MLTRGMFVTAAALCAFSSAAAAQGYFDFGRIPGVPESPSVQIDLGPALINFAAEAARQTDPVAAELMAGLQGIRVRVYEELVDAAAVNAFVDEASGSLESEGWERVVFVDDGESKVRIYARTSGNEIDGMTVLVLDSSDAVFINIAGRIDPAQLGRLAGAMGFGGMLDGLAGGGPPSPPPPSPPPAPTPPSPPPAPAAPSDGDRSDEARSEED